MFGIQIFVIFLGLFGTIMTFKFSPQIESRTFLYQDSEMKKIIARDKRKRKLSKIGLLLVVSSFLLQMALLIADQYYFNS